MIKNGFSLIELLIVMAIVGMLFGLGTVGLLRLKDTLSAEQGVNQMSSELKSEKNKAKNNVLDETKLIATGHANVFNNLNNYMFGTKLGFNNDSGTIDKWLCWRDINLAWGSLSSLSNCIALDPIIAIGGIRFVTAGFILPEYGCDYVLFENLTEQMYVDKPGNCKVNIVTDTFTVPPFRQMVFYKTLGYYEIL